MEFRGFSKYIYGVQLRDTTALTEKVLVSRAWYRDTDIVVSPVNVEYLRTSALPYLALNNWTQGTNYQDYSSLLGIQNHGIMDVINRS